MITGPSGTPGASLSPASQPLFTETNLVTDDNAFLTSQGYTAAAHVDPNLINPWGIAFAPLGPFWISDNGTGLSTVYDGNGTNFGLNVIIPAPAGSPPGTGSSPTGQVYNGSSTDFIIRSGGHSAPATFLFATEDGTISGWSASLDFTHAVMAVDNSAAAAGAAVYKGLAIAQNGGANFLYAANFRHGTVDVFDSSFTFKQSFTDPTIPAGYAPFNVQNIGGTLYVTYALQDAAKHDDVAGPGNGFVDQFSPNGILLKRVASGGALDSPWAVDIAPAGFGKFANDLLVGNFGNGEINVYDPTTGAYLGMLDNSSGNPLVIGDLWALTNGGGGSSGDANTVYFTAGVMNEAHGLLGALALAAGAVLTSVGSFVAQENAIRTPLASAGIGSMAAGYAGPTANNVVGWSDLAAASGGLALGSGYNAVLLDGPRSSYAIQVTAGGVATIKDIGVGDANLGQSVMVSGASYLIFNGGSSTTVAGLPVYDQIYFIDSPANAQLAQFFAGATQFKSSIALAGLEYWENQLAAGMSLTAIAQSFLNTSYFQTTYGDPGTTHAQHVSYVEALYQNILGMTLDAGNAGVAYWAGQMDNGSLSGATTLISFTNATATTSTINAVSGAVAGSGAGWLIAAMLTGGYADPGLQEGAATVLSQGAPSNFYNLTLIDPTSVSGAGVTANGVTVIPGLVSLSAGAPSATVYMSAAFTQLVAANGGDSIHDGPGADSITVSGSGNVLTLGTASTDALNLGNATNSYVFGFAPGGHGSAVAASGTVNGTAVTLLNGTTTAVQGSALAFGTAASSSPIYVNIGGVGGGSSAEVVAAANKAYLVAGSNGNASTGTLGEHVMFLGTDSGGNTELWAFRGPLSTVTVNGHAVQAPIAGADVGGNHLVDAGEISLVATLIGVPAASLTAADLA